MYAHNLYVSENVTQKAVCCYCRFMIETLSIIYDLEYIYFWVVNNARLSGRMRWSGSYEVGVEMFNKSLRFTTVFNNVFPTVQAGS